MRLAVSCPQKHDVARLKGEGSNGHRRVPDGKLVGFLGIADTTKEDAPKAIERMKASGLTSIKGTDRPGGHRLGAAGSELEGGAGSALPL